MDYIRYENEGQVVTLSVDKDSGEVVGLSVGEPLKDERFPWFEKKVKTVKLADLYEQAGYPDYALRARTCATWLKYGEFMENGKKRKLEAANFCQLRLCPMCMARRARKSAYKLSRVLDKVQAAHNCKYLFLTLGMRNVPGDRLSDAYDQLLGGWHKLTMHRKFKRAVHGTARFMETTRGDNRWHMGKDGKPRFYADMGYHPHLHVILAVLPEYFDDESLYMEQPELIKMWRLALGVDYDPTVHIEATRKKGEAVASLAAAMEASKYPVKDEEYIDTTLPDKRLVEVLRDYTEALKGRRMTSFGGWFKEAARSLDADNLDDDTDLVNVDGETIRDDVADLIAIYNWNFGVGDYILTSREINPLKVVRIEPDPLPLPLSWPARVGVDADEKKYPEDDMFKFWKVDEDV